MLITKNPALKQSLSLQYVMWLAEQFYIATLYHRLLDISGLEWPLANTTFHKPVAQTRL